MVITGKNVIWQVVATVLLSGIKFMNTFMPFSMGFIEREENSKKKAILYALSCITVGLRFSWIDALKFGISIAFIYALINVTTSLNFRRKNDIYFYLFLTGFLIEMLWCAFDGVLVYDVLIAILKGGASAIGYFLFGKLENFNKEMDDKKFLQVTAGFGLLLMGLQDINIFNINIKNIFCIYAVLLLASSNGVKYSTMAGLILGTMNEISSPNMGVSIISLTLGGFVAGLFREKSLILQIWGFLLGNSILAYYIMGYNSLIMKSLEIFVAGSIFYVLSKKKINDIIILQPATVPMLKESTGTFKNLEASSGSLYSVSELIDDFEVDEDESDLDIFDEIKESVCFSCDEYEQCWDKNYDEISDEIYSVIEKLEDNEEVTSDNFLNEEGCGKSKQVFDKIVNKYADFKAQKNEQPINIFKQCVSNQFKGFSKYITQMKDKLYDDNEENMEIKLTKAFEKENLQVEKININMDEKGCEVALKVEENMPKVGFILVANTILSKVLEKRMVVCDERKNYMIFREEKSLKADTAVLTRKADDENTIGDSYKVVENFDNKYMVILSDGMGTGEEAAKVSSSLVELFVEMSKTGIDVGMITNMINSFMTYISKTEKIVTLDSMSVDLLTGEGEFLKVGSAPSFIMRGKNVDIISCDTLPLGIFDNVEFFQKKYMLEVGDIIVLVSDGVIDSKRNVINKEFWVSSFLRNLDISEPKIIAEELLQKTIENYDGHVKDDITIVVSRVTKDESKY